MTASFSIDQVPGIDLAAASSWAAVDRIYADALATIAAMATVPDARAAGWAGVTPIAPTRTVGGLAVDRSRARHASDETATFPRQAA